MTLLELIQEFCRRQGLPAPTAVMNSNDDMLLQIAGLLNEILDDLQQRKAYTFLQTEATFLSIVGEDQGTIASLAPGFVKLLDNLLYNRTSNDIIFGNIPSLEWQAEKAGFTSISETQFRIKDSHLFLSPEPAENSTIAFEYQSLYSVINASGSIKQYFTADTDTCKYPDALLIAGLRWIWRREKGLRFGDYMRSYEIMVANLGGNDSPAQPIDTGACYESGPGIVIPEGNWSVS